MLSNFSWLSFALGAVFVMFVLPLLQGMLHGKAKSVRTA